MGVRSRAERLAFRRGISLLTLTLLLPGSAQLLVGGVGLGRFALRVWMVVVGTLLLFGVGLLVARDWALAVYAFPLTQTALSVIVLVLGVGWALLFLDAWRLSCPRSMGGRGKYWMAALAGILAFAVGFGSTQAAALSRSQAALFGSVFVGGGKADPSEGRINVLLLGADADPKRPGIRTDTIMVASVSAETGRTALFSLPRNLQWAPFPRTSPLYAQYPDGFWCPDESCLLNAVYNLGQENDHLYPGVPQPGLVAIREAVAEILGLQINYHVMIDMGGFEDIIDALGGVTLDIAERVPMGGGSSPIFDYIEPGQGVHLDGYHALWFARSRVGSDDYARMARQKCVVNAVAKQATPMNVLTRFNELATTGAAIVTTDIPTGEIGPLITMAEQGRLLPIASTSFAPPLIQPVKPDLERIREIVAEQIAASVAKDVAVARRSGQADRSTGTAAPVSAAPDTGEAAESPEEPRQAEDLSDLCGVA
ncbi:MAG: LCP family protein [Propioniciclava sp.]